MVSDSANETLVNNLLTAIDHARDCPLPNLLIGLGVEHLGPTTAELLARRFGDIETISAADIDDIAAIDGIGPIIAQSVKDFFEDTHHRAVIGKLSKNGVRLDFVEGEADVPQILEGRSVVVTGSLDGWFVTREEAKQAIRARGGKSPGGVSKNTYALVVGAEAGQTKLDKASDLGIPILGEIELRHLLQTGQLP